jgi:prolyl 4-hydroxylase
VEESALSHTLDAFEQTDAGGHALMLPPRSAREPYEPVSLDGFLSNAECQEILRELEFTLWRPSLAYQRGPSGYQNVLNLAFRVSLTAFEEWFTDELKDILRQIERRLQKIVAFDPRHLESWQASKYAANGYVNYHLDSGYWNGHSSGDRVFTFLLYLTTPQKGGSTHFRALDIDVAARTGRLLAWHNLFEDGAADYRMIHAGRPLLEGEKITLVTWVRQHPYRAHYVSLPE